MFSQNKCLLKNISDIMGENFGGLCLAPFCRCPCSFPASHIFVCLF